ncbi:regucalcin-like [Clavelina lepadiformis]|uniref:Regucalcin n=1 Tax=Clavelina lepadiformis TaxID=159417 RepID=A0ABP0GZT9_CLALP
MSPKVQLVHKTECGIGEGPHWDDLTNTLLYVDIPASLVYRWDPVTSQLKSCVVKDRSVGAVVPRKKGGLVVAAGHRFAFLDETTGEMETIQECNKEFPHSRFNDGKCDPAGRFWAGTMGLEQKPAHPRPKEGSLYCLDNDHSVKKTVSPVDISNGLSWSHDKRTMYYCDTLRFTIDAYDYDITTGNISNMREVCHFDRNTDGFPDGHAIDVDGNLWVAMFSTSLILKLDPRTGQKLETIKVSDTALKTTSVCFGGPNLDELYVTSARNSPLMDGEDLSGALFKITELGTKGYPANVYEG